MTLTFGSLFAGIGGMDLGLERAGLECKWQCEIDDYATRVLEKHWPNVRRHRDVRDFPPPAWVECPCCENFLCTWHGCHAHDCPEDECPDLETWDGEWGLNPYEEFHPKWKEIDVICGGFPCQDISLAGDGAGIDGERSGLWAEFARVVRVLRPRIVVVENVSALAIRGLDRVLGDLAALGFNAEWEVLPASAFGAPHRRERVFVVAHASGEGLEVSEQKAVFGARWRQEGGAITKCGWWTTEPELGRVAHGVPARVDRLRCLGNAVVPQVAEFIGRRIIESTT